MQRLDAGQDKLRIERRAIGAGVDEVGGEERLDGGLAHLFVAVGNHVGEIDEGDALSDGDLLCPLAVLAVDALDVAVCPAVADGQAKTGSELRLWPWFPQPFSSCTSRRCGRFRAGG